MPASVHGPPRGTSAQTAPIGGGARTLGVIYNARSGRHRRLWADCPLPADVPAIGADNADEIAAAVARMAERGVDLLAVAGGDGTVQSVLSRVMLGGGFSRLPVLALIATGSTNMTANDVGVVDLRRRGWQPLRDWAAAPRDIGQRITQRPVLRIQPGGGGQAFCGMFFGAGAVHHAVKYTQHNLHGVGLRGPMGPGLAFSRFVKAVGTGDRRYFAPVAMRIHDGPRGIVEQANLLFLASTLNRLVLRFHPFWASEAAPLAWTAVADGARGLFYRLPAVARGRPSRAMTPANGYTSRNSHSLTLSFDGGYIVDGEFFEADSATGPVRLSVTGPGSFLNLA